MKASQELSRKRKPLRSHHKKAFRNPKTQPMIEETTRHWKKLNKIQRGDRLVALVKHGCTRRGLAHNLALSLTTIRRYLELADLSKQEREAISHGASAKAALNRRDGVRRTEYLRQLRALEQSTGGLSDLAAEVIVDFLRNLVKQGRIIKGDLDPLFQGIRLKVRLLRQGTGFLKTHPGITDPEKIIQHCKPADIPRGSDAIWLEKYVEWVCRIAESVTRNNGIRDLAIEKAEKRAELEFRNLPRGGYRKKKYGETTWY